MKKLLFFLFSFTLIQGIYAQVHTMVQESNSVIRGICTEVNENGWLYINENLIINPDSFFFNYYESLGLGINDSIGLKFDIIDDLGIRHAKYQQFHDGYRVESSELLLHSKDLHLTLVNGTIVENLVNYEINIEESKALSNALDSIIAETYYWQVPDLEAEIRAETHDTSATYYPKGELIYAYLEQEGLWANNYVFCYYFEINVYQPHKKYGIYVDANNGNVLKIIGLAQECNPVIGTCTTLYNGNQDIHIKHRGWPYYDYQLTDCTHGDGIITYPTQASEFNNSLAWGTGANISVQAGLSAHWGVGKVWDFFDSKFGYDGTDNNGRKLKIFSHVSIGTASWEKKAGHDLFRLGISSATGLDKVGLDVLGHEYTHGIIYRTSGLHPVKESGALAESFGDIFGTMVERYVQGGSYDWNFGTNSEIVRSLETPSASPYLDPDIYEGANWVSVVGCNTKKGDDCGIHTNCGVQNKWFYLLSTGGTFNSQTVIAIGIDAAANIAFKNMRCYLTCNSGYYDARAGSIQAATDIYGACSNQVAQVKNAWSAVGVGAANNTFCLNLTGQSHICEEDLSETYTYVAVSPLPSTYSWNVPNTWTKTISGNTLTVTNIPSPINTSISVTASNGASSVTLNRYITFDECDVTPCPGCPLRIGLFNKSIVTYPNPSSNYIVVELPNENIDYQVKIIDVLGSVVLSKSISSTNNFIDLRELSEGTYSLMVGQEVFHIQVIK